LSRSALQIVCLTHQFKLLSREHFHGYCSVVAQHIGMKV